LSYNEFGVSQFATLVSANNRITAATVSSEARMAAFEKVPDGEPGEPLAYLVVDDGGSERSVPVFDQLFVGR
jgi:adenylate cyclase